jgi:hypothetical protein
MSGWKQWQIAEVVEADDFQNLIQDQVVQVYATEAARGSALGTAVTEGMVSYINSTNQIAVYDGASWGGISQAISPNYIINGAFDFWQRGTSFTTFSQYTADRWRNVFSVAATTLSLTRQAFTAGELNAVGFGQPEFYLRHTITTLGSGTNPRLEQPIEDVRNLANQTVTVSFYAKADTASTQNVELVQVFGTGGSGSVSVSSTYSVTTSWQRFSVTLALPSVSGKTIGANSHTLLRIFQRAADGSVLDIWGVQLEAGSVATPFRRNANSIQGELAACQRYYVRYTGPNLYSTFGVGLAVSTTQTRIVIPLPVPMRVSPTSVEFSTLGLYDGVNLPGVNGVALAETSTSTPAVNATVASGLTQFRPYVLLSNNSASGFLGFSAEL